MVKTIMVIFKDKAYKPRFNNNNLHVGLDWVPGHPC